MYYFKTEPDPNFPNKPTWDTYSIKYVKEVDALNWYYKYGKNLAESMGRKLLFFNSGNQIKINNALMP